MKIHNSLKQALSNILSDAIFQCYSIQVDDLKLELPPKKDLGDFAYGPFLLAKELKKSPIEISHTLALALKSHPMIAEVSVAGPYLNLRLDFRAYSELFTLPSLSIFPQAGNGKKLIVDYIGTNVGKALHIGHMCTPNIGQVFVNLFRKIGYEVIADNHIGDWGIIFGKLIYALKNWGTLQNLQENAVDYLQSLYIEATNRAETDPSLEDAYRAEFKELSLGNPEYIEYWKLITKESIEAMDTQLARLNVKEDFNIGESFYEGIGLPKLADYPDLTYTMKDVVQELIEKGIATQNPDGSVGIEFPEGDKLPSCMLQKRDGTHGYFAADLACVKYRMMNWAPTRIVYFSDVRQKLHYEQFFRVSQLAGWVPETQLFHAINGFITLKEGAMSSRHGNIIKLKALLYEAHERAKAILVEKRPDLEGVALEDLAEIIGIGAIKYGYLTKNRTSDVVFDWDEFLSFEGNSFAYIAYTYVRCLRLLEKFPSVIPPSALAIHTKEEANLVNLMTSFSEVVSEASEGIFSHYLTGFVYDLAKSFNALYQNVSIIDDEQHHASRKWILTEYKTMLEEVFEVLAIKLPESM